MSSELYLVAHKVRGEPAFDIAERQPCSECRTYEYIESIAVAKSNSGCPECDQRGFWWIVSTSGHRAYPYWSEDINALMYAAGYIVDKSMPTDLPDHYPSRTPPQTKFSGKSLLSQLGLIPKVVRRL